MSRRLCCGENKRIISVRSQREGGGEQTEGGETWQKVWNTMTCVYWTDQRGLFSRSTDQNTERGERVWLQGDSPRTSSGETHLSDTENILTLIFMFVSAVDNSAFLVLFFVFWRFHSLISAPDFQNKTKNMMWERKMFSETHFPTVCCVI